MFIYFGMWNFHVSNFSLCLVLIAYHVSINRIFDALYTMSFSFSDKSIWNHKIVTSNNRERKRFVFSVQSVGVRSTLSVHIFILFWIDRVYYFFFFFTMENKRFLKCLNVGVKFKTIKEVERKKKIIFFIKKEKKTLLLISILLQTFYHQLKIKKR